MEEIQEPKDDFVTKFLLNYKKHLKIIIPTFLLFLGTVALISHNKTKSDKAFLAAEMAYFNWAESSVPKALKKAISAHPELHQAYDGLIVQRLLSKENVKDTDIYLGKLLKRVSSAHPFYTRFSATSIKIAKGDMEAALNETIALQEEMKKSEEFWDGRVENAPYGNVLFAYNTLRLAMLYDKSGDKESALICYSELKELLNDDHPHKSGFDMISSHLRQGDYTLEGYVDLKIESLR